MKPIEAGCLAIIVGGNYSDNIGKEVRVEKKNQIETSIIGKPVWRIHAINGDLKVCVNEDLEFKGQSWGLALEIHLMRIDGGEPKNMVDKRINFLEVK